MWWQPSVGQVLLPPGFARFLLRGWGLKILGYFLVTPGQLTWLTGLTSFSWQAWGLGEATALPPQLGTASKGLLSPRNKLGPEP